MENQALHYRQTARRNRSGIPHNAETQGRPPRGEPEAGTQLELRSLLIQAGRERGGRNALDVAALVTDPRDQLVAKMRSRGRTISCRWVTI